MRNLGAPEVVHEEARELYLDLVQRADLIYIELGGSFEGIGSRQVLAALGAIAEHLTEQKGTK